MSARRTPEEVVGRQVTRRTFLEMAVGSLVTPLAVAVGHLLGMRDAHGAQGDASAPSASAARASMAEPTGEDVICAIASGVIALIATGLLRAHATARDHDGLNPRNPGGQGMEGSDVPRSGVWPDDRREESVAVSKRGLT